jgi:hypothetical protein
MEPGCVNLRERFGRRYKITYEKSYAAAYGPKATREAPWLQIIPGARGHVYPHTTTMLAATTNKSGPTARHLTALPFVQVWTDGSDGVTVVFPPDRLEEVAELLKLRRRRRITDQERDRLTELGRRHRFQPRQAAVQSSSGALKSTIDPEDDPKAVRSEKSFFDL